MNPAALQLPDGPEMRDWLAAEEAAIERLLQLAEASAELDPERSMYALVEAKRRAQELLQVRQWLDLR